MKQDSNDVNSDWNGINYTSSGISKAKVYYETQRTLHPFSEWVQGEPRGIFLNNSTSRPHFHTTLIPGRTRAQPSMKIVRGESGIALMPVFHLGVQYWDQLQTSDFCARDNVYFYRTLGIADIIVATGKIPISRTTRPTCL